jgi:tripartite-type tricarboxylate transporter receptor subunit TctC
MRVVFHLVLLFLAAASPALADEPWPQKPVRVVVPFPGGGSNDALCRIVGQKLSAAWGQPVTIDNLPGAGGNVGADSVFRAPNDGYTLLCSPPGPLSINPYLYKSLSYDATKFAAISVLASVPNVITARKDLPADSVPELIAYARANPGKVTYASQGGGSTSHLTGRMFATTASLDLVHVPYKGEGPALVDIAASRVDIFIGNIAAALRFQKAKEVKFLGVTARTRSPASPDTPNAVEFGLPELVAGTWFALVAPPGTSDELVQKIATDVGAALMLADLRASFLAQGAEPVGRSPALTTAFIKEEEARWRAVIKTANVAVE